MKADDLKKKISYLKPDEQKEVLRAFEFAKKPTPEVCFYRLIS